jgi:hypothetical protein
VPLALANQFYLHELAVQEENERRRYYLQTGRYPPSTPSSPSTTETSLTLDTDDDLYEPFLTTEDQTFGLGLSTSHPTPTPSPSSTPSPRRSLQASPDELVDIVQELSSLVLEEEITSDTTSESFVTPLTSPQNSTPTSPFAPATILPPESNPSYIETSVQTQNTPFRPEASQQIPPHNSRQVRVFVYENDQLVDQYTARTVRVYYRRGSLDIHSIYIRDPQRQNNAPRQRGTD